MLVPGVIASLLCAVVEFIMDKKSRRSWRRDGPVRKTYFAFHQFYMLNFRLSNFQSAVFRDMCESLRFAADFRAGDHRLVHAASPAAGIVGAAAAAAAMPNAAEAIEEKKRLLFLLQKQELV